jgi:hypothetical protein
MFESNVLRNQLIAARAAMGLQTRNPDNRPVKFPVILARKAGETELYETKEGSPDEQPVVLALPIFGPPLSLLSPDSRKVARFPVSWKGFLGGKNKDQFMAELAADGFDGFDIEVDVYPADFAVMIAKIAYSYAIAKYGDQLIQETEIADLILGKKNEITNYVGNLPLNNLEPDNIAFHRLALQMMDDNTLIARVKLFARIGTPDYVVVLGKGNREILEGDGRPYSLE